jgi:tRNA G18 (ribose-2'-O)-methylase SpoU
VLRSIKIILILNNIRSTYNVGNIFRTADIFNVDCIYLCGYTPAPKHNNDLRLPHVANKLHNQISKVALGAEEFVKFEVFDNVSNAVNKAKEMGYDVACLEQNAKSIKLHQFNPPKHLALVLGNELNGVDDWTLKVSDVILEIEQYGQKESLNVANATAIALYAIKTTNYE